MGDAFGWLTCMAPKRIRVHCGGQRYLSTLGEGWSTNELLASFRAKFSLDVGCSIRIVIQGGKFDGDSIEHIDDLVDGDEIRLERGELEVSPASVTAPISPSTAPAEAVEWLAAFGDDEAVQKDVAMWRGGMPVLPLDLPTEDSLKDDVGRVCSSSKKVKIAVDILATVGLGLESFGKMMSFPPYSAAVVAVGKLCRTIADVKHNNDVCICIRRRVAAVLPVLVTVWKRMQADGGCTVMDSVRASILGVKDTIDALSTEVAKFADTNAVVKLFKSSDFDKTVNRLQDEMDRQLGVLQLSLTEDQSRQLSSLLGYTQDLRREIAVKLGAIQRSVDNLSDRMTEMSARMEDGLAKMAEAASIAGGSGSEGPSLVLRGVSEASKVHEMIMSGSTRKVFVRDRKARGTAPLEPGGPSGHHYSCDVRMPSNEIRSFRFTQRDSDNLFVFDRDHRHQVVGSRARITVGESRPYAPDGLTFPDMSVLLYFVQEVWMACPLGARVMALCQQAASLTNPKDPVGCTLVMSALALRVWHGESRCRVTIQTTWSVDELVANLRDKLRVAADAKVRLVINGGKFDGDEIMDASDLCAEDELRLQVVGPSGGSSSVATPTHVVDTLPSVPAPAAVEWLAQFVHNPDVKKDIQTWKDNMPEVPEEPAPPRDKIAEAIMKVAPTVQDAASIVDLLTTIGIGLDSFGQMLALPPFTLALGAIGKLFQVADLVSFNTENCNRVRRRVAALLPVLITVWRRIRADPSCSVSESIRSCISTMSSIIEDLTGQIKNYCDASFVTRAFKSSTFKSHVEDSQAELDKQMAILQLALTADQGRQLTVLLNNSKRLMIDVNNKLDGIQESIGSVGVSVDALTKMLDERTREIMESALKERTDLIVHGVTDVRDVQAMLMSGTTRKLFVRDRKDKGTPPIEAGGPEGHHYSADFRTPDGKLHSFRFTQRLEDSRFVFDRDHRGQFEGKVIHITKGASKPYDRDGLSYDTMMQLLLTVHEVCEASGFTGESMYCN